MNETPNDGIAEAVREIQRTAARAATVQIFNMKCDAGNGEKLDIPALVLTTVEGATEVRSLAEEMKGGSDLAKQQRLANAAGPDKREGTASHQSLLSFIAHTLRFKDKDSAVWANAAQRILVSVLDYHFAGSTAAARWGKHRGQYQCPLSEAWLAWGGGKALELKQDDFAALLDSRDRELCSGKLPNGKEAPDPAALITLASNLEVFSHATAKRERDPNTGRLKISFTEEKGVSGTVTPPPSFMVFIPVFQDSEPEPLEVRLRVTVVDGHAVFSVQLHAAGDVLREAFDRLRQLVADATELPVFVGTPE